MAKRDPELGVLTSNEAAFGAIARAIGTPAYVYDARLIRERYAAFEQAFAGYPHAVHYAMKANSTLAVAGLLRGLGAGVDVNSGGELEAALRAGFTPDEIVVTGVGKTPGELERAVELGVRAINAESPGEVDRIAAIARRMGRTARVAVRVNPDVDAGSHPHISTGLYATKFGTGVDGSRAMARDVARRPGLALAGLHVHVGSQVARLDPLVRAAKTVADLARELLDEGIPLAHLDLGGGLGIAYRDDDAAPAVEAYAAALIDVVRPTDLSLVLEPGRWIVGPAGTLLTAVVDLKRRADGGWFVVVDAGMTDLLRPSLYGAFHRISAVAPRGGAPILADVVGPVCETSDTLGANRELPPLEVGDLLAVHDVGAYGAVMASNYNRRPAPAEVLVEDDRWRVVRRRQTVDDLLQWDEPC